MRFRELFEDSRQKLYHNVSQEKGKVVFTQDKLPAYWEHYVDGELIAGTSLSRNPRMGRDFSQPLFGPVQLVLDQDKLKRNHKLLTLDADVTLHSNTRLRDRSMPGRQEAFQEEFLVGELENLHKYLDRIVWIKDIDKESRVLGQNDKEYLKLVKKYAKKYKVPFYDVNDRRQKQYDVSDNRVRSRYKKGSNL